MPSIENGPYLVSVHFKVKYLTVIDKLALMKLMKLMKLSL